MRDILQLISKVAAGESSILIEGESGTGKELVARAIHRLSPRSDKPFVRVNCGVLNDNLLESELFGHEQGAFTGAIKRRKGRFELANTGTLFLDEIGELSLDKIITGSPAKRVRACWRRANYFRRYPHNRCNKP